MMSKKLLVTVLALALLAAAVGVGIHILHRDARADVTYTVETTSDGVPVAGVSIRIQFTESEYYDGSTNEMGRFWATRPEPFSGNWLITDFDLNWNFAEGSPIEVAGSITFREVPLE